MSLQPDTVLYLACAIFSIGVYGVLSRQNLIVILMSLELMLNAVNLAVVVLGRTLYRAGGPPGDAGHPQVLVLIVLAVAAAEAAVGLSILLAVYRKWRSTNAGVIDLLKG